jgi:thioredoxin-related protein
MKTLNIFLLILSIFSLYETNPINNKEYIDIINKIKTLRTKISNETETKDFVPDKA